MKTVTTPNETVTEKTESNWKESFSSPVAETSYHELAETPVVAKDALAQLHTNVELLADLQSRLSFVMREVRYLMKA